MGERVYQPLTDQRAVGSLHGKLVFKALRVSRRYCQAGLVRITFVEGDDFDRPCVGFAISRKVGGAVVRNRLRRRLRVIAEELAPKLRPGAYLISASPGAASSTFQELQANVSAAAAKVLRKGDS